MNIDLGSIQADYNIQLVFRYFRITDSQISKGLWNTWIFYHFCMWSSGVCLNIFSENSTSSKAHFIVGWLKSSEKSFYCFETSLLKNQHILNFVIGTTQNIVSYGFLFPPPHQILCFPWVTLKWLQKRRLNAFCLFCVCVFAMWQHHWKKPLWSLKDTTLKIAVV